MKHFDLLFVGGHHTSAIPLIKKFMNDGYSIKFIGHRYASIHNKYDSSEYNEITSMGIDYIDLKAPKFYKISGLKKYMDFFKSFLFCLNYLFSNRPRLIIAFGGYLSVPVVISGWFLGISSVTHEQTVVAGLANKVASVFTKKTYLSWSTSMLRNSKTEVVGLPLRNEILKIPPKDNSKNQLNTLFIQGGKQGSNIINNFVFKNIDYLTSTFKEVIHQTGRTSSNKDHLVAKKLSLKYKNYTSFEYIYGNDYADVLKKADVLLSRSGAHMAYEVCYLKIPTVFVPISWSSHNEQYNNALASSKFTPSVVLQEDTLSAETFDKKLKELSLLLHEKYIDIDTSATEKMYNSIVSNFLSKDV